MELKQEQLRSAELFAMLPKHAFEHVYEWVCRCGVFYEAQTNEILIRPGEAARYLYIVLDGYIQGTRYSIEGNELNSSAFSPAGNRLILCLSCITGTPVSNYYKATSPTKLLLIPRREYLNMIDQIPEFKDVVLRYVCLTSEQRLAHLYSIQYRRARHRITSYLLDQCRQANQTCGGFTLRLPASTEVIAQSLNLSRPAFSKELHAMEREGLVKIGYRFIQIPSIQRLQEIMQDT